METKHCESMLPIRPHLASLDHALEELVVSMSQRSFLPMYINIIYIIISNQLSDLVISNEMVPLGNLVDRAIAQNTKVLVHILVQW